MCGQGSRPGVHLDGARGGRLEVVQPGGLGRQLAVLLGLLVPVVLPCSAREQGCEPGAAPKKEGATNCRGVQQL